MKEAKIRKWHRNFGICLAVFILLQAASGMLLSVGDLSTPHAHASVTEKDNHHHEETSFDLDSLIGSIHHGAGSIGALYRIIISIGIMGMAISGSIIFLKVKARTKPKRQKENTD